MIMELLGHCGESSFVKTSRFLPIIKFVTQKCVHGDKLHPAKDSSISSVSDEKSPLQPAPFMVENSWRVSLSLLGFFHSKMR